MQHKKASELGNRETEAEGEEAEGEEAEG